MLENVHLVLKDNASNMERAKEDADVNNFVCFVHSLQLLVHDGVYTKSACS